MKIRLSSPPHAFPCLSLLVLAGCGDPDQMTDGTAGSGGSQPDGLACDGSAEVVLTDDTNYTFSNTLDVGHTRLKDATDLEFDWGGLTKDLFLHDMDARTDVKMFLIALMGQTPEQIEEQLKVDGNLISYNKGAIGVYPGGEFTTAKLTEFSLVGQSTPIQEDELWEFFDTSAPGYEFDPSSHTFLVMAQADTEPGKDAQMLHMFTLDPTATETSLSLTDDSTVVSYEVELEDSEPARVPVGRADFRIQWKEMTRTALGNEFKPIQVTETAIAHYSKTLAELEENFLDLEQLADGWWSSEVQAGTSVRLDSLTNESGEAFSGITNEGLWLFATFCTAACTNPAPWSIAILKPCE